jgi:hypothetical protein
MIQAIRSDERHHLDAGWLSTYWHFSFDDYFDPDNVSFGPLRVFNDDVIQPSSGFPMHPHREMEIVTYVIDGALKHRDDMGNEGVIRPGEVQRMSAGTGVRHSEFNPSKIDPVHLIQLWIQPAVKGIPPSWEQKSYSEEKRIGQLLPIAVPAGKNSNGAVSIQQDATIYTSLLEPGQGVTHSLGSGRRAYIFVIDGKLNVNGSPRTFSVNGQTLGKGDQARISAESELKLAAADAKTAVDFLLLDLPH